MIENTQFLNAEIINELLDVLSGDISDILEEFRNSALELIATARTAHSENNTDTLITSVHSLKGAAGNIGLQQLFESSQQLEQALRNNEEINVGEWLEKIQNEYFQTIAELQVQGLIK